MSKTIDSFDDASTVKIGIGWIIAETFRLSTRRIEASIWEIRTSRSFRCFTPVVPSEAVGYGRQSNIKIFYWMRRGPTREEYRYPPWRVYVDLSLATTPTMKPFASDFFPVDIYSAYYSSFSLQRITNISNRPVLTCSERRYNSPHG